VQYSADAVARALWNWSLQGKVGRIAARRKMEEKRRNVLNLTGVWFLGIEIRTKVS
jgi:hypothetical protein